MLLFFIASVTTAALGCGIGCLLLRGPRLELARLREAQEALDREFAALDRTFRELHAALIPGDPDDLDADDDDFIDDRSNRRNAALEVELAALRREFAEMDESLGDLFGDEFSPDDRFTLA